MTATLDNSKKLYELTGWDDTQFRYEESKTVHGESKIVITTNKQYVAAIYTPAYDSDYLLEKLPKVIDSNLLTLKKCDGYHSAEDCYMAYYNILEDKQIADTPADALCLLAIKLKEEGVM